MSTELAVVQAPAATPVRAPQRSHLIQPTSFAEVVHMAEFLAKSGLVGSALRGKPADIAVILLKGSELNIPPMTALAQIHVIEGKPSCSPELMRALAVKAGHRITFKDMSDTSVTVVGTRGDSGETLSITWDIARAQKANLTGKGTWKSYPQAMLTARATAELVRYHFPELGIGYVPEELGAEVDEAGAVIESRVLPPEPEPDPNAEHQRAVAEFVEEVKVAGLADELKAWGKERGYTSWHPARVSPEQLAAAREWAATPDDVDESDDPEDEESSLFADIDAGRVDP